MTEENRAYQEILRERSSDNLPFVDDVLVRRTTRQIINTVAATPLDQSINLQIPYTFSSEERMQVIQRLNRRHRIVAGRTSFLNAQVEHEGTKVPGTVINIRRR